MKKILILGVNGLLGNSLYRYFTINNQCLVTGTVRNKREYLSQIKETANIIEVKDVFDKDQLVKLFERFDYVINCIGVIKQKNNDNYIEAIKLNSFFPHFLASICDDVNNRLIHFSTDCIFDGRKGNYQDEDFPTARDLYGRTKALGEVSYNEHLTLRTSIIGHEINSHVSLIDWFLHTTSPIKGFSKALFSGLPAREIASFILHKIINNPTTITGLFNLSADPISKYNLLKLVNKIYGLNKEIQIDDSFTINRSLNSTKLRQLVNYDPLDWSGLVEIMLEDYINLKEFKKYEK